MRFMSWPRAAGTRPAAWPDAVAVALLNLSRQNEHGDERVDREGLDEAEADDHRDLDLREHFGLAAHGLHGAAAHEAEADARADGGETDADRERESESSGEIHWFTSLGRVACGTRVFIINAR